MGHSSATARTLQCVEPSAGLVCCVVLISSASRSSSIERGLSARDKLCTFFFTEHQLRLRPTSCKSRSSGQSMMNSAEHRFLYPSDVVGPYASCRLALLSVCCGHVTRASPLVDFPRRLGLHLRQHLVADNARTQRLPLLALRRMDGRQDQ